MRGEEKLTEWERDKCNMGRVLFSSQRLCNSLNSLLLVRHLVRVKCNCSYCVDVLDHQ